MTEIFNPQWSKFCDYRGGRGSGKPHSSPPKWYSGISRTSAEDFEIYLADAKRYCPRAVEFMTEYAKWRLTANG